MALTVCYGWIGVCAAQSNLPERDARFLDRLEQELGLNDQQVHQLDSLYQTTHQALAVLQEEIDALESSDASEKEITMRVAIKSQEKKDLKDEREAELLLLLSEDQRTTYETEIKPAKPAVLHFGIHNRADCKVCTR